jgi:uncharacterized protein (TIGR03437 family)
MTPSVGSLSNGFYTAPSVINTAQSVTVTARSVADTTKSASATVQLTPAAGGAVSVGINPPSANLTASQSAQFTATVTGNANTAVTWSMTPSLGSLTNGFYTAPSVINAAQSVTVTATSVADSTKSSSATVQLTPIASVTVSINPPSATLVTSQSAQFIATVTGNSNSSVTWSMTPSVGSLSSGFYTAPSVINTAQSVTITATSVADSTKSASATVQLTPNMSVAVSPTSASLTPSQTRQFTATVSGDSNTAVSWSMTPSVGSLSNGLYTAPSAINVPQSVTITATSVADPSKSGSATIQLIPSGSGVNIGVNPPSVTLTTSQSTQFTATVTGNANTAVTWSMNPALGSLTNGFYTAPSVVSGSQSITVTATSVADSSKSASATVQLTPSGGSVSISLSPSNSTLTPSQSVQFTANVTGNSTTGVTWSMTPSVGNLSNGLYTAPSTISSVQSVTITATSVADPSQSGSATIQLTPTGGVSGISVSPPNSTLAPSQSVQLTANVAGSSNTAVTWSMTPSVGSLSNGLYTAPSTVSSAQSITVTATSVADPSKSGSATIQLTITGSNISLRLSPSSAALSPSQSLQFTAAVVGTSDTAVVWSLTGGGSMTNAGLYTAPTITPVPPTVTITATLLHSVGPPITASAVITLSATNDIGNAPTVTSIINAATLGGGPLSPGEIIAIQGTGLAPDEPSTFTVDASGTVPNSLANTQVLFDGVPATLLYAQANQINLIVPYSVVAGTTASVEVAYQGRLSNPIALPIVSASPGLFTLAPTVWGYQQGAVLNEDGSVNSPDNPAAAGDWVSMYATGAGQTIPPGVDGQIVGATPPLPVLPVSVKIGGMDSEVLYAGSVPDLVAGVLVINVRIPANAPTGSAVAVVFGVGDNSSQGSVGIAIK